MLHALLTFLGAFALFLFEPYLGKSLTPKFGGGAQTWVICLLFFQVVLLAGYSYAHLVARKVPQRWQTRLHAGLLLLAVGVAASRSMLGGHPWLGAVTGLPQDPARELLVALTKGAAVPMALLAATSPLFHHWYSRSKGQASPFHLYAWSNAGSIGGLLAYPFLLEPWLGSSSQGVLLLGLLALFAIGVWWAPSGQELDPSEAAGLEGASTQTQVFWVVAAALGSAAFMAASATITLEVSSVPLLWILPLIAYLASFIFVFDARWAWAGTDWRPLWGILLLLAFWGTQSAARTAHAEFWMIAGGALFTFAGGMLCHGLLYDRRPGPSGATKFLLLTALGGALGGVLLALGAPLMFDRLYDLGGVAMLLSLFLAVQSMGQRRLTQFCQGAVALGLMLFAAWSLQKEAGTPGLFVRNFYGVVRVLRRDPLMLMDNLKTLHGFEDQRTPGAPLTYYTPDSGIGRALRTKMAGSAKLKVGAIGLGIGSVACYDRPGDEYAFFEINPAVNELAGPTSRVFHLLRDAPSPVELVEGDGRLVLERELAQGRPRRFDLLLVDAFTGDSVPWHLLTTEALQLYFAHLAPDGILAIHVTNPLPVDRLVMLSARDLGLYGVYIVDVPKPSGLPAQWHSMSRYVLLAKSPNALAGPLILDGALVGFGPKVFQGQSQDSWKLAFLKGDATWTDHRSSTWDLVFKRSVLDELKSRGIKPIPLTSSALSVSPSLLPRDPSR